MPILGIISALLPILSKLIDIFQKTPEEKIGDVKGALLSYLEDIGAGLKKAKETNGDTSELERLLNRRR